MLRYYNVDARARTWLKDVLKVHPDSRPSYAIRSFLSKCSSIWDSGVVLGLTLPSPYYDEFDFDSGRTVGYGPIAGEPLIKDALCSLIHNSFKTDPNLLYLFDESNSEPGDPVWESDGDQYLKQSVVYNNNAIVYFINSQNATRHLISDVIDQTYTINFAMAIFECPDALKSLLQNDRLPDSLLTSIHPNLIGFAVHAYDFEGVVIWTKKAIATDLLEQDPTNIPWML